MWIGPEQDRQAEQQRQQRQSRNRDVNGEDETHRLAQIVVDAAAEPDGLDDRAEIVVEQHDRRRLARDIGSASAHRDADVRRLERGRIVDAVAGHRHDLAVRLERVDDAELLLRHDPREHGRRAHPLPIRFAQLLEFFAGDELFGVEARLRAIALAVAG